MMKVIHKEMKDGLLEIQVQVSAEEVEESYNEAYKSIAQEISIRGFRKGKAPRRLVETRIGPDVLTDEAKRTLEPKVFAYAVETLNLHILNKPIIEGDLSPREDTTYTIKVEVVPEVELGPYVDLQIEMEPIEVTEEEIEQQLKVIQSRFSTLNRVEREYVEMGDYLYLDLEAYLHGELLSNYSKKDFAFELGTLANKRFEESCVGLKVGEEETFWVSYPDTSYDKDLAGNDIEYKVTVKEIKEIEPPELHDDFAKKYLNRPDIDSLQGLREELKRELLETKKRESEIEYQRLLMDKIAASSKIEPPDHMVEEELNRLVETTLKIFKEQMVGIDEKNEELREELKRQHHRQAVINITDSMILNAVAQKEGFQVETDEVNRELEEMAKESKIDKRQYRRKILKENRLDEIKRIVLRKKTIAFLHENNSVIYSNAKEEEKEEIDV